MKKIFLLSALFIFACSGGDSSDDNNNNSNNPGIQKLIESINVISGECENTENLWLYYDNENRITSYEVQYVETDCNGQQGYYGPITEFQVEYVENFLTFSVPGGTLTSPINDDGTINDANMTFVNGYLILEDPNAGGNWGFLDCEKTYVWVDNNLIEINEMFDENNCDGTQTVYEYSQNLNLIPFFWPRNYVGFGTAFELTGAAGKQSQNLISKETRLRPWGQESYDFQYQFDADGYPTVIYTRHSVNGIPDIFVNYEITYIE